MVGEKTAQEQEVVGGRLPQEQAIPEKTPAPKLRMSQGKKTKEDTTWGLVKPWMTLAT